MIKDCFGRKIKIGSWVEICFNVWDPAKKKQFACFRFLCKNAAIISSELSQNCGYYSRYFKVKNQADLEHIRKITGQ